MLRACAIDFKGSWDRRLSLMEFSYNNSYQATIGMAPYEALYGRKCRSPVCWDEVGERRILGPELIEKTAEKIQVIRKRMAATQSRQKSYADKRIWNSEFQVGDSVFLKVSPKKGILRFGKRGKLTPRYIGPFEILDKIGSVAYRLALPPSLSEVHNVFHVSMLRKYQPDPSHVLSYDNLPIEVDLSFIEQPVQVLDRKDKTLRNKIIGLVKVLWQHHGNQEVTWEREDEMREKYLHLFSDAGMNLGTKFL